MYSVAWHPIPTVSWHPYCGLASHPYCALASDLIDVIHGVYSRACPVICTTNNYHHRIHGVYSRACPGARRRVPGAVVRIVLGRQPLRGGQRVLQANEQQACLRTHAPRLAHQLRWAYLCLGRRYLCAPFDSLRSTCIATFFVSWVGSVVTCVLPYNLNCIYQLYLPYNPNCVSSYAGYS